MSLHDILHNVYIFKPLLNVILQNMLQQWLFLAL